MEKGHKRIVSKSLPLHQLLETVVPLSETPVPENRPVEKVTFTEQTEKGNVLTSDAEDAFFRGFLALDKLKEKINSEKGEGFDCIDFSGNGYCSDAVIKILTESLSEKDWNKVKEIRFCGCFLLTDVGIGWLTKIQAKCSSLSMIDVSGCPKLTNGSIRALTTKWPTVHIQALGTSVTNTFANVSIGSNNEEISGRGEISRSCNLCILPHKDVKFSLANYLKGGTKKVLSNYNYVQIKMDNWDMNAAELTHDMMYETFIDSNPSQIIIPFNMDTSEASIKQHVSQAITRVLSRERFTAVTTSSTGDPTSHCSNLNMEGEGVLSLYKVTKVPSADYQGFYSSAAPFSRSNPKFEVQCMSASEESRMVLYTDLPHFKGELLVVGNVYSLEVETEWKSEHTPKDEQVKLSFKCNGEKVLSRSVSWLSGFNPCLTLQDAYCKVKILNGFGNYLTCPPQMVDVCYIDRAACDKNGVITNYGDGNHRSLVFSRVSVGRQYRSLTVKILETGNKANIAIGMGPDTYPRDNQPGWRANSIGYHGDDGCLFNGSGSGRAFGSKWKNNDIIEMRVSEFDDDFVTMNSTMAVEWFLNGKKVGSTVNFKYNSDSRCVFIIGLHAANQKVQILNFYRSKPPQRTQRNKLTTMRCLNASLTDDGLLSYLKSEKKDAYGSFISNTPLNKDLQYFEMTVIGKAGAGQISMGLAPDKIKDNHMIGRDNYTIGYHAENGRIHHEQGTGLSTYKPVIYEEGDIVGCGIENADFDVNGDLMPQQNLQVYFTLNGEKVVQGHIYEYKTDGIYPAITLHTTGDKVQLHNFTAQIPVFGQQAEFIQKNNNAENTEDGCSFITVGIGKEDNKKSTQFTKLLSPKTLVDATSLDPTIAKLQKNMKNLNLADQERLSELLWQKECLVKFMESSNRLKFLTVDTSEKDENTNGAKKLKNLINEHENSFASRHIDKYIITTSTQKLLKTTLTGINKTGLSETTATRGIIQQLSKQGEIVQLSGWKQSVTLSPKSLVKYIGNLGEPETPVGDQSVCVDSQTLAWTEEQLASALSISDVKLMKEVIHLLGIVKIPCLRTKQTDEHFLYTPLEKIISDNDKMDRYNDRTDLFVVKRTYTFNFNLPPSLFLQVVNTANEYFRLLLLSQSSAVYQKGAVQVVIQNVNNVSLNIESRCYCPMSGVRAEVVADVEEYTTNVFFLFTDIIDGVLHYLHLTPQIIDYVPFNLVNTSIGCTHNWSGSMRDKPRNSVCTLCGQCCEKGRGCSWSGIVGEVTSLCNCQTLQYGCQDCGICKKCANELWKLRSVLRPCADVTMVESENKGHHSMFPLDGQTYDEFICTPLVSNNPVCLKLYNDTSEHVIQVFPGPAVEIEKNGDLLLYNKNQHNLWNSRLNAGDELRVILHSVPQDVDDIQQDSIKTQEVKPVFFSSINREVRICHETGILCYETIGNTPVGQFIAPKPLSENCNRFSMKVLNSGEHGYIAIGLAHKRYRPNRQPGWDISSCGYHGDDGGIFEGYGSPQLKKTKYGKGAIVACEFDFEMGQYKFYLNNELIYTSTNARIPPGGFYPMVGFHSLGECVQLLEKEPWEITPEEFNTTTIPKSFDTYKYGNLWISPGAVLNMMMKRQQLKGWLLLYNPSRGTVAYVIHESTDVFGTLGPRENRSERVTVLSDSDIVQVEWFTVDSGRSYTTDAIKEEYSKTTEGSRFTHGLKVLKMSNQKSGGTSATTLPLTKTSLPKPPGIGYTMEVILNGENKSSYWLKSGKYHAYVPNINLSVGELAVIRYPKFPTFDFPCFFQRGMTVLADLTQKGEVYTECLVTEVKNGGKMLAIEYTTTSDDDTVTQSVEIDVSSSVIQLENVKTDVKLTSKDMEEGRDQVDNPTTGPTIEVEELVASVEGYEQSLGKLGLSSRGFCPAPHFLVTKDSRKVLELGFDIRWKETLLFSKATCSTLPTRVAFHEKLQVNAVARRESSIGYILENIQVFSIHLPTGLNHVNLTLPSSRDMFSRVSMHLLCCPGELVQEHSDFERTFQPHLMDMTPTEVAGSITPEELYGNMAAGITYTQLTARKLILNKYDELFDGGKPDLTKEQTEALLHHMLKIYTSLCHLYTEFYGGLKNAEIFVQDQKHNLDKSLKENDRVVEMGSEFINKSNVLTQLPNEHLVCKAHLLSEQGLFQSLYNETTMEWDHYKPYEEAVYCFVREKIKINIIPSEFFCTFSNLNTMSLRNCSELTQIPEGLSSCKHLNYLRLVDLPKLKSLPDDIFMSPSITFLEISKIPLETLPGKFLKTSSLDTLILSSLGLEALPEGIGNLSHLTTLNLNYNPLTDLPMTMSSLKNLKELHIDGMCLLEFETGFKSADFTNWIREEVPFYSYIRGEKVVEELFKRFDINNSGTLDIDEVASLNNYLFWAVPRLGSADINDKQYGGIPPVIFLLTNLEYLSLRYQAITSVPVYMCGLRNLRNIDLTSDPLLESLPGPLGHLPNLTNINLFRCPSLRTPPNEVVQRGFESVLAYLKRLAGGFTECRRTKLMLVGLGGAGKTSLLKAIMSSNNKTQGTKGEQITDGIVIQPWTIKNEDDVEVTYSTWDFAGQTLYYNTHQFFLSKRAIYILVWSTRQGFEHAGLDFWLSSIASHAPKTPIFIVGTHCDQVPKADIAANELKKHYPQIADFYFVSCIDGTNIQKLKEDMLRVTLAQKNMGEKIPQVWLNLEKKFLEARKNNSILKWKTIQQYGMEEGIYDQKDMKEAVQFLHELGTVQYFDNDVLCDYVVINPQWIVNVMSCVVSVKESPIQEKEGEFHHSDMKKIWGDYPEDLHQWLLQLTEQFDLTFPLPSDNMNIVPCLLPHEEPKEAIESRWPSNEELKKKGKNQSKMVYKFSYLPAGLFNRCQVRLFQFSNGKEIWKRGSLLKKNNHIALIRQISENELEIQVCGQKPANIIFLVHEIIEGLIEESFHGVVYDFLVPCPDCIIKEGTLDPSLLDADLVHRAKDHKAPFIQCRKYFHTISMGQIDEIMPSDGKTDFDAHLQRSIIMMQELNTEMTKDVAILYSASDLPGNNTDKLNPVRIKNDLEKSGYSCWFNGDMRTVSINELTLAVKNCKVVVALVSDNFEKDDKCCGLLFESKQYIIAPIGTDKNWHNSDLGMRIGKQEQMIIFKNKEVYESRFKDLEKAVNEKLSGVNKRESMGHPECFLSYCWSNSLSAVQKGTQKKPGALGHWDPRVIKEHLASKGINVWLDCEQTSVNRALYNNISTGLRHAKVVVACVSDEYSESVNCMMELRFAVLNLGLPVVLAVVGTGKEWKSSEIGLLQQRNQSPKVYFQNEKDSAFDSLVSYVKDSLKTANSKAINVKEKRTEVSQQAAKQEKNNISYQEERELLQRKFMRHIISFMSRQDQTPMPRLIIVDLEKGAKIKSMRTSKAVAMSKVSSMSGSSSLSIFRPKTATRSKERIQVMEEDDIDIDDIWDEDGLCIKMLCEHEEGWHLCEKSFSFTRTESAKEKLKSMSPYLGRLYAIAKQCHINLECLQGSRGENFVSWIEQEAKEHTDFLHGFQTLRNLLIEENSDQSIAFLEQLVRCHLPSGKIYWLCEEHQKMPRVTKLSTTNTGPSIILKNLYQEDILLKEYMEKSDIYLKKKAQKSTPKIQLPSLKETETYAPIKKSQPSTSKEKLETKESGEKGKDKTNPSSKDNNPRKNDSTAKIKNVETVVGIVGQASKSPATNDKNSKMCSVQ